VTFSEERRHSALPLTGEGRICDHLFNGLDAGNRLFGEGKPESNRTQELSVHVHGAAAHALHDASPLEWTAAESGQDDSLLWSEVFKDTEDLDLELFDVVAVEDSAPSTLETGTDVF